jgi:hypothetical protein
MEGKIMRTEKDIMTTCYDIQDACNFSLYTVCRELSRTLEDLRIAGIDHYKLKDHPAVIILVDKINDMMGRPDINTILNAFQECRKIKDLKEPAPIIEVD